LAKPVYDRVEAPATPDQKDLLERLSPEQVQFTELAGEESRLSSPTRRATVLPLAG